MLYFLQNNALIKIFNNYINFGKLDETYFYFLNKELSGKAYVIRKQHL